MNPLRDTSFGLKTAHAAEGKNVTARMHSRDVLDSRVLRMSEVDIKQTLAYAKLRELSLLNEDGTLKFIPSYFKGRDPQGIWVYYRIKHIDNSNCSVEYISKLLPNRTPKTSTVFSTTMSAAWTSSSWNVSNSTEAAYEAGSNTKGS